MSKAKNQDFGILYIPYSPEVLVIILSHNTLNCLYILCRYSVMASTVAYFGANSCYTVTQALAISYCTFFLQFCMFL